MSKRVPKAVNNKKFCKDEIGRRWMETAVNVGMVMAGAWMLETIAHASDYAWIGLGGVLMGILVKARLKRMMKETVACS